MPRRTRSPASSLRSSSPRTTSRFVGVFPPLRGWLSPTRFCDGRGVRPRDRASRAALHWARGSARTGWELSPFSWPGHGPAARRRCRLRARARGNRRRIRGPGRRCSSRSR
jgi:hypothetical protein